MNLKTDEYTPAPPSKLRINVTFLKKFSILALQSIMGLSKSTKNDFFDYTSVFITKNKVRKKLVRFFQKRLLMAQNHD